MPVGKLLAGESYGPLRIIGSQGAVVFLEGGAPGRRSTVGVLCFSVQKLTKLATPPLDGPLGTMALRGLSFFERTGMPRAERDKCLKPAMRSFDI